MSIPNVVMLVLFGVMSDSEEKNQLSIDKLTVSSMLNHNPNKVGKWLIIGSNCYLIFLLFLHIVI
jgi:hypothetical protein